MSPVLAVDIGGRGVRTARVDEDAITDRIQVAFAPTGSLDEWRAAWRQAVGALAPGPSDVAMGISLPGFVDRTGRVAPGIHLHALAGVHTDDLFDGLGGGRPMVLLPDVAAAALAAARHSAPARRVLCVVLGTGTNAALAVDRRVVEVAGGCLGDAGHIIVEEDGEACRCGGRGCLETVCAGDALARHGAPFGFCDAAAAVAGAESGDERAQWLLARAGRGLGRALAGWAAMTFPDEVVVVGGLSAAGEWLLGPARTEMRRVGQPSRVWSLAVNVDPDGADAALLGAGIAATIGNRGGSEQGATWRRPS